MPNQTKRVFLGFSLNAAQTTAIQAIQQQLPATLRLVPSANLHMTLAFLGAATPEQIHALIGQLERLNKPKFSVTLDKVVHWQKPKILCLNGDATDDNLCQLSHAAQQIAAKLGLHCSEYSYNPHITLSRKAKASVDGIEYQALTLTPTQLQLFESYSGANGVEYPTLHSWNLA